MMRGALGCPLYVGDASIQEQRPIENSPPILRQDEFYYSPGRPGSCARNDTGPGRHASADYCARSTDLFVIR